jgi:hypothetical protein
VRVQFLNRGLTFYFCQQGTVSVLNCFNWACGLSGKEISTADSLVPGLAVDPQGDCSLASVSL